MSKVYFLGLHQTKDELLTQLNNRQQILATTSSEPNTDPLYIKIQQDSIAELQNVINNFDINSKNITATPDQAAIDYALNEGYDEDGNHYKTLNGYKNPHSNIKKDNTPWQKGDDLAA